MALSQQQGSNRFIGIPYTIDTCGGVNRLPGANPLNIFGTGKIIVAGIARTILEAPCDDICWRSKPRFVDCAGSGTRTDQACTP